MDGSLSAMDGGSEATLRDEAALYAEVAALRRQVHDLKAWVSISTRAGVATATAVPTIASDDELADALVHLAHGLQNWVLTHFRRAAFRAGDRTSTAFSQLVPIDGDGGGDGGDGDGDGDGDGGQTLAGLTAAARLPLLQSAAARVLVDDVFAAYFVGLPPADAALLAQTEARLRTYGMCRPGLEKEVVPSVPSDPAAPAEAVRQWRAQTLALVAADAAQLLPPETQRSTDAVVARIVRVLDEVTQSPTAAAAARDHGLRQLVASAVALARVLAAQRAEYELFMPTVLPHQQLLLDPSTMETIGTDDDDDDRPCRREVACVVFPGLIKRGDEAGRHVQQYTNVLCKARVLCRWET